MRRDRMAEGMGKSKSPDTSEPGSPGSRSGATRHAPSSWKRYWFDRRVGEREEMNRTQIARGIPRDACLDPQLTAISEYYLLGLHRTEEED